MKLFIVGYMAGGKTTFGKALAEELHYPFIDLDEYIENNQGKNISQLFADAGESEFRRIEKDALHEVAAIDGNLIVACGGGTPCYFDNMDFINQNGISLFLEASTPVLVERLQASNASRPIMAGKTDDEIREKVLTQLRDRLPFYLEAKLKWSGDELNSPQEVKENVKSFISEFPSLFRIDS